jgi:branched-chain amino acid transport system permease protein
MNQLVINTLYNASLFYIVAFSFSLLYFASKKFYISHAAIIMLAPYFVFFLNSLGVEFLFSIVFGIFLSTIIGFLTEVIIYRKIRFRSTNSLVFLVASLGLYIIFQNTISILFGNEVKSIALRDIQVANYLLGGYITNIQLLILMIGFIVAIIQFVIFKYLKIGKSIRAISSNPLLSNIYGIRNNNIMSFVFIVGSFFASISGILHALDKGIQPVMGFNLFLYGVIAMIIGGSEKLWGLVLGAIVLSLAQNIAAFFLDIKWMDAATYLILIIFLIIKPLGISGQRQKKVEI